MSSLDPLDERLAVIHAELIGSDTCTANGITAQSTTPVLQLCRTLTERGCDPASPLHAYRGGTLCLIVRSIGEAAGLEINAHGTDFIARRERRAGPPMRGDGLAGVRQRGRP